jgi:hypothetical protein
MLDGRGGIYAADRGDVRLVEQRRQIDGRIEVEISRRSAQLFRLVADPILEARDKRGHIARAVVRNRSHGAHLEADRRP